MNTVRKANWHDDSQFDNQLYNSSAKSVVLNRWKNFSYFIYEYCSEHALSRINVLDLGSGDGVNIEGLLNISRQLNIDMQITAVDINMDRLNKLKERFGDAIHILQYDLQSKVHTELGNYDVVIFNHVLEHLSDDALALNLMKSFLKPNGVCVLGVPNEGCFNAAIRNKLLQRNILQTTDHVQFYTYRKVSTLIDSQNLSIVKYVRNGFFYPHLRLHALMNRFALGRLISKMLSRFFSSQSAEMMFLLTQKA